MRICKATRDKRNCKYSMGSQTLKTTVIFTFLFYKEFVIFHSASYTDSSVYLSCFREELPPVK